MRKLTSLCKKAALVLMALMVVTLLVPANQAFAAKSYVKSMTLSKTTANVKAGKSTTAKATVKVAGSASKKVVVSSSNKAVATVSVGSPKSGVSTITIKGVKKGTATITVKSYGKNSNKAQIKKTIKVTVQYANVTGLTVTPASKTLNIGQSFTISKTVAPAKANPNVTYTSNATGVATVTTAGKVTAKKAGTAKITVKTKGTNSNGKVLSKVVTVTVKDPNAFTAADYSVVKGTKNVYIAFTINKDNVTEEELKAQGFDVEGGEASKTVECETATYKFKKLPRNLAELKKISLDTKFGPMAAMICALTTYETVSNGMYSHPIYDMFDYLQGVDVYGDSMKNSNARKSGVYYSMDKTLGAKTSTSDSNHQGAKFCYFDGATPQNKYTPAKDANGCYTFTMYHGPYYIPAKETINGPRPETQMILIEFAGGDSQRYIDVFQSSQNNKWYSWKEQWCGMIAGVKDPVSVAW